MYCIGCRQQHWHFVQELQDSEVMSAAIDQCGSILSSIVGTTFEQSSRRSRIKHVLQDKVGCVKRVGVARGCT